MRANDETTAKQLHELLVHNGISMCLCTVLHSQEQLSGPFVVLFTVNSSEMEKWKKDCSRVYSIKMIVLGMSYSAMKPQFNSKHIEKGATEKKKKRETAKQAVSQTFTKDAHTCMGRNQCERCYYICIFTSTVPSSM